MKHDTNPGIHILIQNWVITQNMATTLKAYSAHTIKYQMPQSTNFKNSSKSENIPGLPWLLILKLMSAGVWLNYVQE